MAFPRFFHRVADATLPLLDGFEQEALSSHLDKTVVRLVCSDNIAEDAALSSGYLFAANLLARLYPRIIIEGPEFLVAQACDLVRQINPNVDIDGAPTLTLSFSANLRDDPGVAVTASGWNVAIDNFMIGDATQAAPAAALAAAAIGAGELFRMVFSDFIPSGRKGPEPGSFNLVTLGSWDDVILPRVFELGNVHLAGAGAIGESVAETLRVTPAKGRLTVVDPEEVDELNLQRYVLAMDADLGERKTALVARALSGTGIQVVEVPTFWGENELSAPGRDLVISALDTAADRIGVQAGLHGRVYNAYTQPADIGWSRHERFGEDTCLACQHWPKGPRPHRYQLIAKALKQPERRVQGYLASGTPVGKPLPANTGLSALQSPPSQEDLQLWLENAILDEIGKTFGVERAKLDDWTGSSVDDLYREGICAGQLVRMRREETARHLIVPLAHQSALSGIMLAVQVLVASDERLKDRRPQDNEGRYNILRGVPSSLAIPSFRTPGCICSDPDFVNTWELLWLKS